MVTQEGKILSYTAVVLGSNPYRAIVPDFTLVASADTVDEVILILSSLLRKSIEIAKSRGTKIPNPTPLNSLQSKWTGEDVKFVTVSVQV